MTPKPDLTIKHWLTCEINTWLIDRGIYTDRVSEEEVDELVEALEKVFSRENKKINKKLGKI